MGIVCGSFKNIFKHMHKYLNLPVCLEDVILQKAAAVKV